MNRTASTFAAVLWAAAAANASEAPEICSDRNLQHAVEILHEGCGKSGCDFEKLKELNLSVDRKAFFGALRNPHLQSLHVFFPRSRYRIEDAFDWKTGKRPQVDSLRYASTSRDSMIFVIGSASTIGSSDFNRNLSANRMESVRSYLERDLGIDCNCFHGGYLGEEMLQLSLSDGKLLRLETQDYRNDQDILNQSVHIFVYPCQLKMNDHSEEHTEH